MREADWRRLIDLDELPLDQHPEAWDSLDRLLLDRIPIDVPIPCPSPSRTWEGFGLLVRSCEQRNLHPHIEWMETLWRAVIYRDFPHCKEWVYGAHSDPRAALALAAREADKKFIERIEIQLDRLPETTLTRQLKERVKDARCPKCESKASYKITAGTGRYCHDLFIDVWCGCGFGGCFFIEMGDTEAFNAIGYEHRGISDE